MASAKAQRLAAIDNERRLIENQGRTTSQLQGFANQGIASIGSNFDQARADINASVAPSLAALGQGYGDAAGAINQNFGQARTDLQNGIAGLDPWTASGRSANTMYGNALGLNGAAGNAAATDAFQTSPGYDFRVDQATDAAARKASALGIAGSGNTLSAITTLGENLANQEYGSWLDRLNGVSTQGLTAANQQLSGATSLATLGATQGTALGSLYKGQADKTADVYGTQGRSLATLGAQQGLGEAGVYSGLGNSIAGVNTATTNGIAQGFQSAAQASDAAKNANQNLALGLLGQGISLFAPNASGASTGGNMLSSLGKLFA